jgi:hypothetical protein
LDFGLSVQTENPFESEISATKIMKFSVGSVVAVVAFFSQEQAGTVQNCASFVLL